MPSLERPDESTLFLKIVQKNTLCSSASLLALYEQAVFCEKRRMAGDYVECGVWKGGSAGLLALVNLRYGSSRRHLHMFDTFDSGKAANTVAEQGGEAVVKGTDDLARSRLMILRGLHAHPEIHATVNDCRELIEKTIGYDPAYAHYHEETFETAVPAVAGEISKIAILKIRAEKCVATRSCLSHMFDKIMKGGFLVIDSYGACEKCKDTIDEFLASQPKPCFLNKVDDTTRYVVVV